ncbi:Conserved_hypothetical protein [Hexamita inflata]|uniref:Uncharacterized protein n=1 Tax=Hexamita inflata TaxID=28002 RepID=A0AA86QWM3_9EUKA|nr:Conserved hypothetical protein [Hexamita inflata]
MPRLVRSKFKSLLFLLILSFLVQFCSPLFPVSGIKRCMTTVRTVFCMKQAQNYQGLPHYLHPLCSSQSAQQFWLRHFYRACSSTILSFVTISILLFTAGVCRFLALFYNDFFGKYMDNNVFAVLCYVVPDFLPCSVITAMQINIMIKHKKEYRPISGLEEESVRLI